MQKHIDDNPGVDIDIFDGEIAYIKKYLEGLTEHKAGKDFQPPKRYEVKPASETMTKMLAGVKTVIP